MSYTCQTCSRTFDLPGWLEEKTTQKIPRRKSEYRGKSHVFKAAVEYAEALVPCCPYCHSKEIAAT